MPTPPGRSPRIRPADRAGQLPDHQLRGLRRRGACQAAGSGIHRRAIRQPHQGGGRLILRRAGAGRPGRHRGADLAAVAVPASAAAPRGSRAGQRGPSSTPDLQREPARRADISGIRDSSPVTGAAEHHAVRHALAGDAGDAAHGAGKPPVPADPQAPQAHVGRTVRACRPHAVRASASEPAATRLPAGEPARRGRRRASRSARSPCPPDSRRALSSGMQAAPACRPPGKSAKRAQSPLTFAS